MNPNTLAAITAVFDSLATLEDTARANGDTDVTDALPWFEDPLRNLMAVADPEQAAAMPAMSRGTSALNPMMGDHFRAA